MQKGNIGVTTENIFPVIKKFLYSDHEIFLREMVSNAVDATQKLKTLAQQGEFKGELGDLTVHVALDTDFNPSPPGVIKNNTIPSAFRSKFFCISSNFSLGFATWSKSHITRPFNTHWLCSLQWPSLPLLYFLSPTVCSTSLV